MTQAEYQSEYRHTYETRLAILEAGPQPTQAQHNLAVSESEAHIKDLKETNHEAAIQPLLELRNTL